MITQISTFIIELLRHHDVRKFGKTKKSKISNFFAFSMHEVPSESKQQPRSSCCCAKHVVKRPSKRMRASII